MEQGWARAFTDEPGETICGVVHFDYETLDAIEDKIKEAVADGRPLAPVVKDLVEDEVEERIANSVHSICAYLASSAGVRLAVDQIGWLVGLHVSQHNALPKLALRHGLSKQAFCAGAMKLAEQLGLKPSRAMRPEIARALMRKVHFKHYKL